MAYHKVRVVELLNLRIQNTVIPEVPLTFPGVDIDREWRPLSAHIYVGEVLAQRAARDDFYKDDVGSVRR
jgi:hypothetical protein